MNERAGRILCTHHLRAWSSNMLVVVDYINYSMLSIQPAFLCLLLLTGVGSLVLFAGFFVLRDALRSALWWQILVLLLPFACTTLYSLWAAAAIQVTLNS